MWGQQKSDFSQLVQETANGAFYDSYDESSLTCSLELNAAILDFARLEVTKYPLSQKSSYRFEILRFVLVTLRAA